MQLPGIFISFIDQLCLGDSSILLALSLSIRMVEQIKPRVPEELLFMEFLHTEYDEGKINSIDEFINALMQEMKNRKAFYKRPAGKLALPLMLVFIDDIFEVIMSPHKKTALTFIELLMVAGAGDMYFIMGSSGIYRNLLDQLINVTPSLKKKLSKSLQEQNIGQPLGAELVMNSDELIFFRERNEKVYGRLYPLI